MVDAAAYTEILKQVQDVAHRIAKLSYELRPAENRVASGRFGPDDLEKIHRLQAEIARLHDLRAHLQELLST